MLTYILYVINISWVQGYSLPLSRASWAAAPSIKKPHTQPLIIRLFHSG